MHDGKKLKNNNTLSKFFKPKNSYRVELHLDDYIINVNLCNRKKLWFQFEESQTVGDILDQIKIEHVRDMNHKFTQEQL